MKTDIPVADSFLRHWWAWILLPVIAWLCSIPCLGAGAFFIPIVIINAPLGILGYFEKITVSPTGEQHTAILFIHAAFWIIFLGGFAFRKILPLGILRTAWIILVFALFMSVSGCAVQLGPGLRNEGNWH